MLFALASAALVLLPQQPQQQQPSDTTLLDPVVVEESAKRTHRYSAAWSSTATKTALPLRDTPQSVSVITRGLIAEQSMQSMADALRYVPGATMGQGEGHRDAPTIRGNSSTADFYVDGVRDDAQYFRDFYNVEQVEVLGGANAMIFGRGGGGGVINRVTKRATLGAEPRRELTLEGGSFGHGRGTLDYSDAVTEALALRLNGLYQHSNGFRDAFTLSRAGVNPSAALRLGERTMARFHAEYFEDMRRVDRGIPSFHGRPSSAPLDVFFGNPDSSRASAAVYNADATLEHRAGERFSFRTFTRATRYDKFYQNVLPGAVDDAGENVSLSAYSSGMDRTNLFNQTEATVRLAGARLPQTLLFGVEVGRQTTDNVRMTGYFNGTATSFSVPFDSPTVATPVEFRPSAADPDNHVVANVASLYAQDQFWLSPKWQATLGARFERFALRLRNNRNGELLNRTDDVFSPRLGLVFKPVTPVSLYSSFSVSHLPSAGDQFAGLTPTTRTLEPERFTNQEIGVKWDPRQDVTLTTAVYQLMRTNSAAPSALDPGVVVQTGKQKTTGLEVSFNGRLAAAWDVAGAFTSQSAKIVSPTSAAPAGAAVPLVPRRTFSLWNRFQVLRTLGLGVGAIHQSDMYAAIDNAVTLPGFWRLDGAVFLGGFQTVRLQLNVENLLDARYYATSHGNNNIMPGAPRTIRFSLVSDLR